MYEQRIAATALSAPVAETRRPRLLIIDDSVVVRSAITRIIEAAGQIEVVDKLPHIEAALEYLRDTEVDLILLDHEMPGRKGLDALPLIIERSRGARVAVLSGYCDEGSESAVRALAMGASDIIAKPSIRHYDEGFAAMLCKRLLRLARHPKAGKNNSAKAPLRSQPAELSLGCIGIGASTGGILALSQLFAAGPASLGVPILITQHLPATFIPYFAAQLGRMTHRPVCVAKEGDTLLADHVYIAPGNANLVCKRRSRSRVIIALSSERATRLDPLPGIDPMFAAMAECYGAGAVGVILTGMGRDGTSGARHIVEAGGCVLAQDEESSVVWGMPGSAAQQGLVSKLMPPVEILPYLGSLQGIVA